MRYGTRRVLEVITDRDAYHGTRIGDRPEDRAEDLFCAVQDFLNVYGREALDPYGFLTPAYREMTLDHPYGEARRRFIINAMCDIPSASRPRETKQEKCSRVR